MSDPKSGAFVPRPGGLAWYDLAPIRSVPTHTIRALRDRVLAHAKAIEIPDDLAALMADDAVRHLRDRCAGRCSKCQAPGLLRRRDDRQIGPTDALGRPAFDGVWFNYKCLACGDFYDVCEPAAVDADRVS